MTVSIDFQRLRRALVPMVLLALAGTLGCERPVQPAPRSTRTSEESRDEGWSQILISFQGAMNSRTDRPRDEARRLAQDLLRRLQGQGASSFERLAHTYSDHSSGGRGGRVEDGTETAPQVERVVQHLRPGEVGPAVVESAEGFHVVKRN
ncbi:MAG: peptidylprolyl isomerase [Planctomycetota bacterium]